MPQQTLVDQALLIIEASQSHSDTPHSVGLFWTSDQPTQRSLPENTQHPQETDLHDPGGIRTRDPSKRAPADPRLRLHGHWDRQEFVIVFMYLDPEYMILNILKNKHKLPVGVKQQ
jgi:hypothetical protein